jgi:hypothetical protein
MPSQRLPSGKQLSELIGAVYDAALDSNLWPTFLGEIATLFGANGALFIHTENRPGNQEHLVSRGLDLDIVSKWAGSRDHVDPWWAPVCALHSGHAMVYSQTIAESWLRTTGFYADYCKPVDIEHGLAGRPENTAERGTTIALLRSSKCMDYTEDHRDALELILPHVRRALTVNRRLALGELATGALPEALHWCPYGAVILDQSGHSLCVNDQADLIFLENDGITLRSGLRFCDYVGQRQFDRLIGQSLSIGDTGWPGSLGGTVVGRRHLGKQPYQVLICPLNQSDRTHFGPRASWLVFIHDPEVDRAISPAVLVQLYQLTESEAGFCTELYRTGRLEDAASSRHISMNTAKTHFKRIFGKTQTSSQAQLIKKLTLSVASAGIRPR